MNINVVGTSGVGKSTLARRLAQILSVPYRQALLARGVAGRAG